MLEDVFGSMSYTIERVLTPGLWEKINGFGHEFTRSSRGRECIRKDGSKFYDYGLLFESETEALAVDAESLFDDIAVEALLSRVQRLREEEKVVRLEGKTIFAAAAGFEFTDEAQQMIKEKGIYKVLIDEKDDKIQISPLSIEKAGRW